MVIVRDEFEGVSIKIVDQRPLLVDVTDPVFIDPT